MQVFGTKNPDQPEGGGGVNSFMKIKCIGLSYITVVSIIVEGASQGSLRLMD